MVTYRLLERTLAATRSLQQGALKFESERAAELDAVEERHRGSARNLLHYLSVRQHDIGDLQQDLNALGLASLVLLESHVMASLSAVAQNLAQLTGDSHSVEPRPPVDFRTGPLLLKDRSRRLLGPPPPSRSVRIMVTLPAEAANDVDLIVSLIRAGTDIMRINCAQADARVWRRMARNVRKAESVLRRRCMVQVDLAGPPMRTGLVGAAGRSVRIRPVRSASGPARVPAQISLTPIESSPGTPPVGYVIRLPSSFIASAEVGDVVRLNGRAGRTHDLTVVQSDGSAGVAETRSPLDVSAGDQCTLLREGSAVGSAIVGQAHGEAAPIPLRVGETLAFVREEALDAGRGWMDEHASSVPIHIHCTTEAAFDRARMGDRVWLDEGRIAAVVTGNAGSRLELRITEVPPSGGRLRSDMQVNFPDTDLELEALTDRDREDLRTVSSFADIVALPYVRAPGDVQMICDELDSIQSPHMGVVLRIDNQVAYRNLPKILLACIRSRPVGVMVQRSDLDAGVGIERFSEHRDEMLWLSEAAHVPVIWATQVLSDLARAGVSTRSALCDAVVGSRAECVMLDYGPGITGTVEFLAQALGRVPPHRDTRMTLRRRLAVASL